jgi:hypothetical protein
MAATNPRSLHTQQVHYLRKSVNFNDSGISTGVLFGTLPAGAQILPFASTISIRTAFNAATTNNLLIGTTAGGNNICATADAAAGTLGIKTLALATVTTNGYAAVDTDLFVTYTQTGAVATAGVATITIAFSVNNDVS